MYFKKNILAIVLVVILFGFGALLITINPSTVISIVMFVIALLLMGIGINFLVQSRVYIGKDKTQLIVQSVALIAMSIVILILPHHNQIVRIVIGCFFILFPAIRLFTVANKMDQFKADLPMYVIGIILILSLESILKIVMIVSGVLLIFVGVYLLVVLFSCMNQPDQPNILTKLLVKYLMKKGRNNKWEL